MIRLLIVTLRELIATIQPDIVTDRELIAMTAPDIVTAQHDIVTG